MSQHSLIMAAAYDAGNVSLMAGAITAHESSSCLGDALILQLTEIAFLGRTPEPRDVIAVSAIAGAILDAEGREQ